jgi:hypothetical protein
LDRTVRGTRDVRDLLSVAPLAVVPVIDNSRSSGLRKRHALLFAAKTVVAVIVVYYAASQFII